MPEITPEKQSFLNNHLEEIKKIVERENVLRARQGFEPLTEEEIDQSVEEMMQSDELVKDYKFSGIKTPKQKPQVKEAANLFRCEIQSCENGHLLTFNGTRFIFKTPKELLKIFQKLFFGEQNGTKEKGIDGDNRGNNPDVGSVSVLPTGKKLQVSA